MRYAHRMERIKDRELLSLMELSEKKDMISFSGGFPSADSYPIEEIKESFYRILEEDPSGALSYSSTRGYGPLRQQIAQRMETHFGTSFSQEQVLITSGSQQALDMAGLLLIDKGDVVLFETPSYLGALNALKAYEAELVAVPTDEDGIVIASLQEAMETYGERVKMIYVIPDFQNPTGRCWSEKRRRDFMELVGHYDVAVLEDAAYSELSFGEEKEIPLIRYDEKQQVIYCGTFSKIFCPGLRIGWVCAGSAVMEELLLLKSSVDLSAPSITQRQTAYYLEHFDLDAHIRENILLYKKRRDAMIAAMKDKFPEGVSFNQPKGGLFLWVTLPESKDSRELLRRAYEAGISFVPGGSFYPGAVKNNEFRLNFSNVSEEKIRTGIEILGRIINDYIAE